MHLVQDVAAPDQLSPYVQLRVGWPFAVQLDLLPNHIILEHVDSLVFGDAVLLEQLNYEI